MVVGVTMFALSDVRELEQLDVALLLEIFERAKGPLQRFEAFSRFLRVVIT